MRLKSDDNILHHEPDINQNLPVIIAVRAAIFLVGINLSNWLEILPKYLGTIEVLPFFNVLTVLLTILYLILWRLRRGTRKQLYFQITVDLFLTTILVAATHGTEGTFVSFYLLIIIYCSLTLGKNGGILSTMLSVACYSGVIVAARTGIINPQDVRADVSLELFRIGFHVLSFGAVAYLGTYLHRRLHVINHALNEKNESLARLRQLNDHIVRGIHSGLITTDLDGCVSVFNPAAGEIMRKEPDEVLGVSICEIIGEKFWELIRETEFPRNARFMRHKEWIRHSDGSIRFLGFTVSPLLDTNCEQLGYIISFQDLSEIVRLEKEVQLRERMAAVGRMAAVIAHEIRNPLTAMRGSAEILRMQANLTEKSERLLNIMISESDRLNSFIGDFLNFAKPESKHKMVIDIIPILRDSVTLMNSSFEIEGNYSVNLDIKVSNMPVFGNADQIRQVFWNVVQNAMRAMPESGNLVINATDVGDGVGEVTFTDNGIGMTPEEIEQIFQPFHSGFSKGLGLGISIVFQIMEDHRGKISFESEKGVGTKVILSFPLKTVDNE